MIANRRFARLLLGRRDSRPGPARPCHFVTHLSRSHGWGTWRLNDDLKLGESTFLGTLSRVAKVPASEEISRYPNWKTPFCHALSCSCHAPVMTKSMMILVLTKSILFLVMTTESFGLLSALRASCLFLLQTEGLPTYYTSKTPEGRRANRSFLWS